MTKRAYYKYYTNTWAVLSGVKGNKSHQLRMQPLQFHMGNSSKHLFTRVYSTEEIKEWVTATSYYITEGNFVSCCGRALSTYPLATCCRSKAAPLAAGQIEFSCFMTRCVRHWGALLHCPDKASVVNTDLSSEIPCGPSVKALSDVFSLWPLCLPLCSPEFPFLTNLFFCPRKTSSSPSHKSFQWCQLMLYFHSFLITSCLF